MSEKPLCKKKCEAAFSLDEPISRQKCYNQAGQGSIIVDAPAKPLPKEPGSPIVTVKIHKITS
ncbi:hypothetical protein EDS67_23825 [candidate division KSB1 bacterium]|nr:MAG: hypothetical protein EDS67_23825 [candidate division KSB1 bacterium]MBC6951364.1 hypothetical protein [candidate division KSB1 bacterium]MCE7944235.1 hypothetical protein [Chlorobi bacterium CHB1]